MEGLLYRLIAQCLDEDEGVNATQAYDAVSQWYNTLSPEGRKRVHEIWLEYRDELLVQSSERC